MATQRRARFKNIDNTGFGGSSTVEGGRLTNKDGSNNLRKVGLPIWERISIYHTLLRMRRGHFFLLVLLFYTTINLFFATIYFAIGVEHLDGVDGAGSAFGKFTEAFFFSSQTLTTVGYGHVAPMGMAANTVASLESFLGILTFAVVTGLIYGRFARPRAFIKFSHNALIAPYKDGQAIMMRLATYKNNHLTDVEAMMTAALRIKEDGKYMSRFYTLKLEISRINSLALSWTLVHALDENSPLYGYSMKDIENSKLEVMVGIKGFDDHFSNIVQQRTSYSHKEFVNGAKFLPMFRAQAGSFTLLELDKINAYEMVPLPTYSNDSVTETVVIKS